jgi:hypothetical protein
MKILTCPDATVLFAGACIALSVGDGPAEERGAETRKLLVTLQGILTLSIPIITQKFTPDYVMRGLSASTKTR